MGAVDAPQTRSSSKKKGKGFHRPKRRVGVRIDMTPMVDVAFLLLIFFMGTTVFRTPQALEINLPPDKDVEIKIKASDVLTGRVVPDNRAYYRRGLTGPWSRRKVDGLHPRFDDHRRDDDI